MRIALIHHKLKLKGGMETYLLNLISEFNNQQDKVTAFIYEKDTFINPPCLIQKTNLSYLPRAWRKMWFGWRINRKTSMQSFDVCISLTRAIKQDMIICGGTHRGYLQSLGKASRFLDKWEIKLEQQSYDTASIIVAHSDLLKQELISLYHVPENKIVKLYPPVDVTKFHQKYPDTRAQICQKYHLNPKKTLLLFPSTDHKRKGLKLLQAALKRLPENDYEVVVAGSKPAYSLPNFIYVGFVQDMAELYNACDVTLLPSFYDPFGLVALESIQCGTPVILSQFVGAKELISENEGIILNELTPEAIVQAILKTKKENLKVQPDFALKKELTVTDHVNRIKEYAYEAKKEKSRTVIK